ncbi:MAG: hypothetical protein FJ308_17285 [Planctomycetes bacterium]|nr:hypothetical protein [Planctomycetota bacterium]
MFQRFDGTISTFVGTSRRTSGKSIHWLTMAGRNASSRAACHSAEWGAATTAIAVGFPLRMARATDRIAEASSACGESIWV